LQASLAKIFRNFIVLLLPRYAKQQFCSFTDLMMFFEDSPCPSEQLYYSLQNSSLTHQASSQKQNYYFN